MEKQRNSYYFYRSFVNALRRLPRESVGEAVIYMSDYALDGIEPPEDGDPVALFAFDQFREVLDANREKWINNSFKSRRSIIIRWMREKKGIDPDSMTDEELNKYVAEYNKEESNTTVFDQGVEFAPKKTRKEVQRNTNVYERTEANTDEYGNIRTNASVYDSIRNHTKNTDKDKEKDKEKEKEKDKEKDNDNENALKDTEPEEQEEHVSTWIPFNKPSDDNDWLGLKKYL